MANQTDPATVTAEDQTQAQAEVQNLITQTQTQALYGALVQARAEVAALRRALAETDDTPDDAPPAKDD